MEHQHEPEVRLEMDIADFSGKTVSRIDIQNVIGRTDPHKAGVAVVITFTDGATATILVRSTQAQVTAAPYSRPRMVDYAVLEEEETVQAP